MEYENVSLVLDLVSAFGKEWHALTRADRQNVAEDCALAIQEDGCDVSEYRRRIGRGNLQAYADCLRVR